MEWIDTKVSKPKHGQRVVVLWPLLKYDYDRDMALSDEIECYVTAVVEYQSNDTFEDAPYADCVGYNFDDDCEYAEQPTHWMPIPPVPAGAPKPAREITTA